MPARRPRSCIPPTSSGSNRSPRRTIRAPAPGGPPNLWALTDTRSASRPARSRSRWPQAAAASTWTGTPAARQAATTSATGWTVPTSWLAHWQCTSAGGRSARRASASATPAGVDPAPAVDGEELGVGQPLGGVAHTRVLDRGAQHRRARTGPGGPPDRGVGRLGAARGEDDLAGPDPEQRGHLLPGLLEDGPHHAALLVDPSRVAGRAGQRPADGVGGLRTRRGGRGVVEVVAGHRGRGLRPTGRRPAQARAAQVSSPRAREESTTGVGPSGASPQRPDKSPLTIPRSTAHRTG